MLLHMPPRHRYRALPRQQPVYLTFRDDQAFSSDFWGMVSPLRHSPLILQRWGLRSSSTTSALPPQFMFHPEVRDALLAGDRPVLAFETTIATHGLSWSFLAEKS